MFTGPGMAARVAAGLVRINYSESAMKGSPGPEQQPGPLRRGYRGPTAPLASATPPPPDGVRRRKRAVAVVCGIALFGGPIARGLLHTNWVVIILLTLATALLGWGMWWAVGQEKLVNLILPCLCLLFTIIPPPQTILNVLVPQRPAPAASPSSGGTVRRSPSVTPSTPSPSPPSCSTTMSVGQEKNGRLETTDCISASRGAGYYADDYVFTGSKGDSVSILLHSGGFETYLILTGPDGAQPQETNTGGAEYGDSRIPEEQGFYQLPASGTYTIEVTSQYQEGLGYYTLTVSNPAVCASTSLTIGEEKNGRLETTDCISAGRGAGYYADDYVFTGSKGDSISILLSSANFETYLILTGPDGTQPQETNTGGPEYGDSRIPEEQGFYRLPASGTYTIEVTSQYQEGTGYYTVTTSGPT